MPIIGNPWAQDAGAFGSQVGNALSQGLLQLPQERYGIALQQAQLARALAQMQATQQYHQGLLANRQEQIQDQNQNQQQLNAIRQQLANIQGGYRGFQENQPIVKDGVLFSPKGQPMIPDQPPINSFNTSLTQGLKSPTPQQSMVPPTNATPQQPSQQGLPTGGSQWQMIPLPGRQVMPNNVQSNNFDLNRLKLLAQILSSTNAPVQQLTNQLPPALGQGQQQMAPTPTNQIRQYNPITGQLQ